ncbi:bifunctional folylpolyglutamate synthase/dihydrofolate synthase [Reinekea marinisedimentorum]|uniref:Dihydrofolate synthase/folylpolyglutamate synthase n=1 Tax=Reinekea marinisedimentorum TaxID=230495 RepID=A0A4R3I832_9GAMM|nr:folylpolyglutamate synthase/dihydrofolate synthase family protein [Reinekea marinisedimentorum]TCS41445.1 dihydrofolate synthase/folylpolyglutamate synthase [Reinekea marinisedimentorum]
MHLSVNSSLEEWLRYIEAIHPTEIDLGLTRLQKVANRLLLNSADPFVFTVAGTNGKGSTTAALNAMALAAGKTVGWYTSPHLLHFNERVVINGQPATDSELVAAFCAVESARVEVTLSYFEYTTLAAFYLFSQKNLSVWVLEIGLGGRLDAVNIINPDVAIVTTIGLDHQAFLGSDLDSIGREKAGICRSGKPVVFGSSDLPESVSQVAEQLGAPAYHFGAEHGVRQGELYWQGGCCPSVDVRIPLENAATAAQAFSLSPFRLAEAQVCQVLCNLRVTGRFQQASYRQHPVVIDVGHNPLAGQYIAAKLAGNHYHLVLGMLADKDAKGFVEALRPITKSVSAVSLNVHRGISAQALAEKIDQPNVCCFDSMSAALADLNEKYPGEAIFIGGSFFTVAEALRTLEG